MRENAKYAGDVDPYKKPREVEESDDDFDDDNFDDDDFEEGDDFESDDFEGTSESSDNN